MKNLAILGSTGSIGSTALDVVRRHRDRFAISALTAFANSDLLGRQVAEFQPSFVGLVEDKPEPSVVASEVEISAMFA